MSVTTRPPAPPTPGGGPANRLPRVKGPADRGREIRLGLLGMLGLVVLVVGIPTALVLLVGYPLPTHAPSRAWLTQSITETLIVKILACVVWLVWAHFVVCLLTEWRAIRRGRLPGHVALGGGSQLLARRLVAATLLLGGAATAFPHSSGHSAGSADRPPAVVAQHAQARAAHTPAHAANPVSRVTQATGADRAVDEGEHAGETKYYVVQPPHGRRYDSLWDIAARTLKDPLRYKEIFALNKDRIQADGSKLVDANLIRPGWELRLPADASGPGVHVAHAASPEASRGPASDGVPRDLSRLPGAPATPRPDNAQTTAAGATRTGAVSRASDDTSLASILLGGGMMLAGVLLALTARRGPYAAPTEDEAALDTAADPGLARLLDRALRRLAADRRQQDRSLPQPVAAWVSAEQITLNLAAGDADEPPAPWRTGNVARSWTVAVADIAALSDVDAPAPFPGLLSVGHERGHELFVDFEQAPGPVAVAGSLDLAREFATALAVQAATSLWSDGARVSLVGFGDGAELVSIDPRAVTQVPHLAGVLDDIEREHADVLRLQRQLGVDGVLTGRQARRDDAWRPHVLVLSGPPTPDEATRLQTLAAGRSNVVVIVVGDLAAARWRFVIDVAGRIDLGVLGASAQARRLNRVAVARLADLLAGADQDRRTAAQQVAGLTPHHAVADLPRLAAPPPVPGLAVATVALLGPVTVEAAGPLDPAKRDLLTEIVVAVALHPDGIHDAVLRASIWPRGVSDDVCAAALADAARWLGVDAPGRPCLYEADGRWHLGPAVRVDWHELRRLAETVGPDEFDALRRAVALFRGEAFSATPAGRYRWLAFVGAARDAKVVGTAVARRAAGLADEAEAEAILRAGLRLVPNSEVLWRDLLVLAGRRGPDGAAAVATEMYETLHRRGSWPESETDALVAQLAPEYAAGRTA